MKSRTIFWRLFWKEYRLQRSLWICMAVLTALVMWLVSAFALNSEERLNWVFHVGSAFSALYCLGCGAALFAGEHEADTYEFQRSLPVRAASVFLGKFSFALVSSTVMFVAMWAVASCVVGSELPDPSRLLALLSLWGLFGLELSLWATCFSLLTGRVLAAAPIGAAVASIILAIVADQMNNNATLEEVAVATVYPRAVIISVLALIDFVLAALWFHEPAPSRSSLRSALSAMGASNRRPVLGRLLWQHRRQSIRMMGAVSGALLLFVAVTTAALSFGFAQPYLPYWPILFSVTVPLLGVCAFAADQRHSSFRFLANHGVPPRSIWLSRLLTPFAFSTLVVIVPLLAAFAYYFYAKSTFSVPYYQIACSTLLAWTCVVIGIAAGQLCSMFLRSGFLAAVFSVILTSLLFAWCWLMSLWGTNWLWSILPIPLALLLATRLRTRYWLVERNDWRAWLPAALAMVIPTVAILPCVLLYRVCQIPLVDPGFSPEEYDRPLTPEEQKTLDIYRQAFSKQTPLRLKKNETYVWADRNGRMTALNQGEIAWVDASRDAIAIAEKASREELLYCSSDQLEQQRLLVFASQLLWCSAVRLEDQGQLDASLEHYLAAIRVSLQLRASDLPSYADAVEMRVYSRLVSWASRPGQTFLRLVGAARQLGQLTSKVSPAVGIKYAYLRTQRTIEDSPGELAARATWPAFSMFWVRLPWERARALRLLNSWTRSQLLDLSAKEHTIQRDGAPSWSFLEQPFPEVVDQETHRTKGWPEIVARGVLDDRDMLLPQFITERDYAAMTASRRAMRLILAIDAWRLQHGSLPKTLDELVGPCLDRLPTDPYSGEPFSYFRNGLDSPLRWSQPTHLGWNSEATGIAEGVITPNTPFLWCLGPKLARVSSSQNVPDRYQRRTDQSPSTATASPARGLQSVGSAFDVWSSGWPFPIP